MKFTDLFLLFGHLRYIVQAVPDHLRRNLRSCFALVGLLPVIDLLIVYWMYILVMTLQGSTMKIAGYTVGQQQFMLVIGGFILLTVVRQIIEYGSIQWTRCFSQALFRDYSTRLLEHYLGLSWASFSSETRAIRLKHVSATALDSAYAFQVVFNFVGSLITLLFLTLTMVAINPYLAVGGAVGLVLFSLISQQLTKKRIAQITTDHNRYERRFYDRIQESLTTFRENRMFGVQAEMSGKVNVELSKLSEAKVQMSLYPHMPRLLLELIFTVVIGLSMLPVVWTNEDNMAGLIAGLASLTLLSRRMIPSMSMLLTSFTEMSRTRSQLEILFAQLKSHLTWQRPYIVQKLAPSVLLHFDNISFVYGSGRRIIDNFSIDISEQERIAIAGETGSGKSTLMMIIAGLLEPSSGQAVMADTMSPSVGSIAYVPQETALLSGTILENIVFGAAEINETLVWHVLEQVNLDRMIGKLAHGLYSEVGDNGVFLSGGERQRLGIARALYRKPRLLLLDESTSALDEETEHEIMSKVGSWIGSGSIVFITHRQMNAARHATRIIHLGEKEG